MTMDDTLEELRRRRLGFKDRRDKIDAELAQRRQALLAEEVTQIANLMAKAYAEGATLGAIKRSYGTKDHRTVTTILEEHEAEVKYWRDAIRNGETDTKWFTLDTDDRVQIDNTYFDIISLADGTIMLSTDVSQWNDDFTIENKTVGEFDGKTEADSSRVQEIAEAYRLRA